MDQVELYPLKFTPIYKQKIWGGTQIHEYKQEPSRMTDIGESWEVSPMPEDASVVSEGSLMGYDLPTLATRYGDQLLGANVVRRYGTTFPLLIKLIHANDDLSIQVHPDDDYAHHKHGCKGKTEMWYMLHTSPKACIYKGWSSPPSSSEKLQEIISSGQLMAHLKRYDVQAGDAFYLPAGTVHTIGKGCLLLEVQEASDITYRLYDFGRKDAQGRTRELHIEDALQVLDYGEYTTQVATESNTLPISSEYFSVSTLSIQGETSVSLEGRGSFSIIFCVSGSAAQVHTAQGSTTIRQGQTILFPASISSYTIIPEGEETLTLIDCHVPTD